MKKKILVTGSSGHSGEEIASLLKENYKIVGIDLVKGKYTQYTGDLRDQNFINQVCRGMDAIVHTASLHAPHIRTHSRKDFIDTNITGTLNLLEATQNNQIKKFIYTSTTSLYGESLDNQKQAVWITEEVSTIPRDIYDISKIAAESLCRDFFNREELQSTVLRVARFWNEPLPQRIFYRMYRALDVRDVAFAHQLAIEKDFDKFEIFNISAQSIFSKDELFALKHQPEQLLEKKIPELLSYYKKMNWKIPQSIDRVYVIDKARKDLGFVPQFNIKELLKEEMNKPT